MKIIKKIKANSVQILEVLMLITVIFLPYILDIPSWFEDYLRDHKPEPEISNFLPYYILKAGNVAISLGLLFAVLIVIRTLGFLKSNSVAISTERTTGSFLLKIRIVSK